MYCTVLYCWHLITLEIPSTSLVPAVEGEEEAREPRAGQTRVLHTSRLHSSSSSRDLASRPRLASRDTLRSAGFTPGRGRGGVSSGGRVLRVLRVLWWLQSGVLRVLPSVVS